MYTPKLLFLEILEIFLKKKMLRGVLFFLLCLFSLGNSNTDILIRENVVSKAQCTRISNEINSTVTDAQLYQIATNSLEIYLESMQFPVYPNITQDSGYVLVKLNDSYEGQKMYAGDHKQAYVGMYLFLNNGGTIVFPRQNTSIVPACGKMILFPNSFTHPYFISPIEKNTFLNFVVTWFK